jgi:hypothetical protein
VASETDICNLALAHLGDSATVSSIDPPEGSAQAEHCARFYPIARDALLEMHDWGFATKRAILAQLSNPSSQWAYCYAQPSDLVNTISVLDRYATDDTSVGMSYPTAWGEAPMTNGGVYTPQAFQLETADDGTDILYTNQANALLRYVARVTDTTRFSPLFIQTLSWSLAAMLAGPVIKGEAGQGEAARCELIAFGRDGKSGKFGLAAASDAGQKRATTRDRQQVSWINAR